MDEVAGKLGGEAVVRRLIEENRLQEFRDRDKLFFKVTQVDALVASGEFTADPDQVVRDDLKFILKKLVGEVHDTCGVHFDPLAEALIHIMAGEPVEGDDSWAEYCRTILDSQPPAMTKMFEQMLAAGKDEEDKFKTLNELLAAAHRSALAVGRVLQGGERLNEKERLELADVLEMISTGQFFKPVFLAHRNAWVNKLLGLSAAESLALQLNPTALIKQVQTGAEVARIQELVSQLRTEEAAQAE